MARHRDTHRASGADDPMGDPYEALPPGSGWAGWDVPSTAGVRLEPCDPIEVYAQGDPRPPDLRDVPTFLTRSNPRRTRWRGVVSLMWAGVLTLAALQHAGEVERKASAREPTAAELAMQDRSARRIHAAWRDIRQSIAAEPVLALGEVDMPEGPAAEAERKDAPTDKVSTPSTGAIDSAARQADAKVQAETKIEELEAPKTQTIAVAGAESEAVAGTKLLENSRDSQLAIAVPEPVAEAPDDEKPKTETALIQPVGERAPPSQVNARAREETNPRTTVAYIRPASGPAVTIEAEERTESPPPQDEELRATVATKPAPRAAQTDEPTVVPSRARSAVRRSRASSLPLIIASVYVSPGEFVARRYFTVYGLNGRAP